jgi:formate/nitrite transporter FocA (FNT family)
MLSFGGLLSEVLSGGSPGLTMSNPGIVKILGGFVFPVGLVMCVVILVLASSIIQSYF